MAVKKHHYRQDTGVLTWVPLVMLGLAGCGEVTLQRQVSRSDLRKKPQLLLPCPRSLRVEHTWIPVCSVNMRHVASSPAKLHSSEFPRPAP